MSKDKQKDDAEAIVVRPKAPSQADKRREYVEEHPEEQEAIEALKDTTRPALAALDEAMANVRGPVGTTTAAARRAAERVEEREKADKAAEKKS